MKRLKYLLILIACLNLQTAIGKNLIKEFKDDENQLVSFYLIDKDEVKIDADEYIALFKGNLHKYKHEKEIIDRYEEIERNIDSWFIEESSFFDDGYFVAAYRNNSCIGVVFFERTIEKNVFKLKVRSFYFVGGDQLAFSILDLEKDVKKIILHYNPFSNSAFWKEIGFKEVEDKDLWGKDSLEYIVEDQEAQSWEDFIYDEMISKIDTVSVKLSVNRDEENYNEEAWKDIQDLAKVFNDTFNNLPENDDSWIYELQNLIRTTCELAKDEKTIHGNLDVSLYGGDKVLEEKTKFSDESNEFVFSFVGERDKKNFNREKWGNVIDSVIDLAKYGETLDKLSDELLDGLNEELLSKITNIVQVCYDFAKDEKLKIERS